LVGIDNSVSVILQIYEDVFETLKRDPARVPASVKKKHPAPASGTVFSVRENDYTMGHKKIGGNAQAILRDRWLHHTSFLWDYREAFMRMLKHPEKCPVYRGNRKHESFVTPIAAFGFDRQEFLETVEDAFVSRGFDLDLTGVQLLLLASPCTLMLPMLLDYPCTPTLTMQHPECALLPVTSQARRPVSCMHCKSFVCSAELSEANEHLDGDYLKVTKVLPFLPTQTRDLPMNE
jgi:hypothetical protein